MTIKPEDGDDDDLGLALALIKEIKFAESNGDMLVAVLKYRKEIRERCIAAVQPTAPVYSKSVVKRLSTQMGLQSTAPDDDSLTVAYMTGRYDGRKEQPEADVLPSEAITGFAAWLTCRRGTLEVGSTHDSSTMAVLANAYCKSQGFADPRDDFHTRMKPGPKEQP